MAMTNNERVGKALNQYVVEGLKPYVEQVLRSHYGENWENELGANRFPGSTNDASSLLNAMMSHWNEAFRDSLGRAERSYVGELLTWRNNWAHNEPFSTDDALRALDTMTRLLTAIQASNEADQITKLKQDLTRSLFQDKARTAERKKADVPISGLAQSNLKSWRDVITPHKDVCEGRFAEAEFAADLYQVWKDEAGPEYNDPQEFFRRTFITDGLRELLLNAIQRLNGKGGNPIVQLQTNFGGGKTHSLIALYHLACGYEPKDLPGIEELVASAKVEYLPKSIKRAVIVGQRVSAGSPTIHSEGIKTNTLWGEIAYQLGGKEAFDLVSEADRLGTNPGTMLSEVVRKCTPCLILIDEWVAYARVLYGARDLPGGSFENQMTFAQALCDAVRDVPGALLVVTIPASDIEKGGEGGEKAVERLSNIVGRMETPWIPATADEGFEIVRRRLFDDMGSDSAVDRDVVIRAFASQYREQRTEFPSGVAEQDYIRRMTASYPIHPELFDRLYGDWSTLDKFQRTRGVLRLMATVVHELWSTGDKSLLIMPATIPIQSQGVRAELLRYLENGWGPVIETDIDGPNALPLLLDQENANLGRLSAARRVARTVFIGSAPDATALRDNTVGRGIDDTHIKLGCSQPGERSEIFGDALRYLASRSTYLVTDRQRYWYSLQQTVTRLARDRAASTITIHDVEQRINQLLRKSANSREGFQSVHVSPESPGDVPDEAYARLVILPPAVSHNPKESGSPAAVLAKRICEERGSGPRNYRNMLIFLAADTSAMASLIEAGRQYLAWESIREDSDGPNPSLNLDSLQKRQVSDQIEQLRKDFDNKVRDAYQNLLIPTCEPSETTISFEETRANGDGSLIERAFRKLEHNDQIYAKWNATSLRHELDRIPLWQGEAVQINQLWESFARYPYLPRLLNKDVLLRAITLGLEEIFVNDGGFAYANTYDKNSRECDGLIVGKSLSPSFLDPHGWLIKAKVAKEIIDRQTKLQDESDLGIDYLPNYESTAANVVEASQTTSTSGTRQRKHKRFFAQVELDQLRMTKNVADISENLVRHLSNTGAIVHVTLEIQATSQNGFDDAVIRVVQENGKVLGFHPDQLGFEEE